MSKHGKQKGQKKEVARTEILFPEVPEAVIGGVFRLPLDLILPNPNQPRKVFNEASIDSMAETLKKHGDVQKPLLVTPRKNKDSKTIALLINGERRKRAAIKAGLSSVSCYIREYMSDKTVFLISTMTNFCEEEMTPIEKAYAIQKIMEDYGWNQAETARQTGLSPGTISNLMRYFSLHEDIQGLVLMGKLDKGVAIQLTTYDKKRQIELLQIVKDEIARRGRPFSPNDMLIFLRQKAEKLNIQKTTRAKKSRPHLSSDELLMQRYFRLIKKAKEMTNLFLKEFAELNFENWKKTNPLTVLEELQTLRETLPRLILKFDKRVG